MSRGIFTACLLEDAVAAVLALQELMNQEIVSNISLDQILPNVFVSSFSFGLPVSETSLAWILQRMSLI